MKRLIKYAFSFLIAFGVFASCREGRVSFYDYPNRVDNKIDTLEVTYIAWACACANWLPTKYLEDSNYSTIENADDCIYIEASNEKLKLPDEYKLGGYGNRIRLIGIFYKDQGISKDYEQPTSQKPEWGKVFRYTEIEIIKPYTIWDFSTEEPSTKTIEKGALTELEKQLAMVLNIFLIKQVKSSIG